MSGGAAVSAAPRRRAPSAGARAARALLACAGALLLGAASVAALALLAAWAAPGLAPDGAAPAFVREGAIQALALAVFVQAVAPHVLVVGVLWPLLLLRWPELDARWWRIAIGGAALGCAASPILTEAFFSAWRPVTPIDAPKTWALLGAAASACHVLARRAVPGLGPGALGGGAERGAA